jgi:hypothetical protein
MKKILNDLKLKFENLNISYGMDKINLIEDTITYA